MKKSIYVLCLSIGNDLFAGQLKCDEARHTFPGQEGAL